VITAQTNLLSRFATLILASGLWVDVAQAGGSGANSHGDDTTLTTVVTLVLGVGAAYLLAHFVVDSLQKRFLLSTNAEYIVLGVLMGPSVAAIPAFQDLTPIAPIIALATGWVGLLYGMEFNLRHLLNTRNHAVRLCLMDGAGVMLPVLFATQWFLQSEWMTTLGSEPIAPAQAWLSSWVLALTAWAGSSDALNVVRRHYPLDGAFIDTLKQTARLGDMLAIAGFGFLFCAYHEVVIPVTGRGPTSIEWGVITVVLGAMLGGLFTVFLGKDESTHNLLLPLVGIITFASGAAFFLDLSAILVNLILGVILVNTAKQGQAVRETLEGTVRPISLILLVFAGALWTPPPLWPTVLVTVGLIVLRLVGKSAFLWVAALGTDIRRDAFRGLIGQGHVAVAMALSMKLVFHGPAIDIAYTAILICVVVHELVAPRLLKGLLVDAGVIQRETAMEA